MREKSPELEIRSLLIKPVKCVIIPHKNPDGDALGSSLAINHFLNDKGHKSIIISPNDYPDFLKWMPGESDIVNFKLNTKESKRVINSADLIFTLDFNDLSRVNEIKSHIEKASAKIIMIDHHENPKDFAHIKISKPEIGSTCELVFGLIESIDKDSITAPIASCLYTGIMTDTGSFKYSSTSSNTHRIIAKLIEKGANNSEIHQNIYETSSLNKLKLLGIALKNLKKIDNKPYVYITLSQNELDKCKFKKGDTEGFVNYGLSLKGICLSIIMIENSDEKIIKMSFRSKGNFAVNVLAEKFFNGGGHINAAGGQSADSLLKTEEKLIEILKSLPSEK
ncbi:MAG: DHH family phosphoesterase [Flavobacteriaceae bacterium]|nr:DHH family phosphoesterase [Flavobacteriaceae bacterium]|tara:strand:- start:4080 stop:5090 length:1011 start_codon:yes stop_codon:yes gene_type:complete